MMRVRNGLIRLKSRIQWGTVVNGIQRFGILTTWQIHEVAGKLITSQKRLYSVEFQLSFLSLVLCHFKLHILVLSLEQLLEVSQQGN
jgi:hypothetical protein